MRESRLPGFRSIFRTALCGNSGCSWVFPARVCDAQWEDQGEKGRLDLLMAVVHCRKENSANETRRAPSDEPDPVGEVRQRLVVIGPNEEV